MQSKILREKRGGGGAKKFATRKIRSNVLNDFNPYYILIKISNIWHNRSESPSNAVNNLKNKINCNYLISGNILFSMLADLARPGRFP